MRSAMLKRYLIGFVVSSLFVSGFVMPTTANAWELNCRGGGNANWIKYSSWNGGNSLVYHYWKSEDSSGVGLQPGQCSWPDRGMWDDEPSQICVTPGIQNSDIVISIEASRSYASVIDWRGHAISALFELMNKPDMYYTFNVYNNGVCGLVLEP